MSQSYKLRKKIKRLLKICVPDYLTDPKSYKVVSARKRLERRMKDYPTMFQGENNGTITDNRFI